MKIAKLVSFLGFLACTSACVRSYNESHSQPDSTVLSDNGSGAKIVVCGLVAKENAQRYTIPFAANSRTIEFGDGATLNVVAASVGKFLCVEGSLSDLTSNSPLLVSSISKIVTTQAPTREVVACTRVQKDQTGFLFRFDIQRRVSLGDGATLNFLEANVGNDICLKVTRSDVSATGPFVFKSVSQVVNTEASKKIVACGPVAKENNNRYTIPFAGSSRAIELGDGATLNAVSASVGKYLCVEGTMEDLTTSEPLLVSSVAKIVTTQSGSREVVACTRVAQNSKGEFLLSFDVLRQVSFGDGATLNFLKDKIGSDICIKMLRKEVSASGPFVFKSVSTVVVP